MKKKVFITIICSILFVSIVSLAFSKRVLISTSSPNGITNVEVFDENSIISLLLFSRKIRFSYWNNEEAIISNQRLVEVDGFSSEFLRQFPSFLWTDDNTLRISRNLKPKLDNGDRILIYNRSSKQLSYLLINAKDLFLKFDPKPGEKLILNIPSQNENSWISVDVGFSDGKVINQSADFLNKNKISNNLTYCVYIDENEKITITNSVLKELQNSSETYLTSDCE